MSTLSVSGNRESGQHFDEACSSIEAAIEYADQAADQHAEKIEITIDGQILVSSAGIKDLLNLDFDVCRACLSVTKAALESR